MKTLMTILLAMTMMMGGVAYAATVSTTGLTPEQTAQMEAQIATIKAENITNKTSGVLEEIADLDEEDIARYADIGKVVSGTIKETAQGLGMAVDEFMSTTTGSLVMFLIIYHFFGSELITFGVGFCFMIPMTLWLSRRFLRMVRIKGVTYTEDNKKQDQFHEEMTAEQSQAIAWIYGLTIVATLIQVLMYLP